jgi:hypothetical protein
MIIPVASIGLVCWLLCGCVSGVSARQAHYPARTIPQIEAMIRLYTTCRSYEDNGELTELRRSDDGSRVSSSKIEFSTAFERNSERFVFSYRRTDTPSFSRPQRGVIWRPGPGLGHSWQSLADDGVRDVPLPMAIDSFVGSADASAIYVPRLLFGRNDNGLENINLEALGEKSIGDAPCVGFRAGGNEHMIELWIALKDYSLRRVFEKAHFRSTVDSFPEIVNSLTEEQRKAVHSIRSTTYPFTAETTIDYLPRFDQSVDSHRFSFTPPPPPPT